MFKWLVAIYLFTSFKKGISSIQLSKYLNVLQKTAWLMPHRIREVNNNNGDNDLLNAQLRLTRHIYAEAM